MKTLDNGRRTCRKEIQFSDEELSVIKSKAHAANRSPAVFIREAALGKELKAAVSDAKINPDGSLSHSLENKKDDLRIPTKRPVEYRDSIVYRDREVEVEKVVEIERKLTWWQQTQIRGFWALLAVVVLIAGKKIRFAGPSDYLDI